MLLRTLTLFKIWRLGLGVTRRYRNIMLLMLAAVVFAMTWHCSEAYGGELSIKPAITLREEFDDNIFLTQNNKVDDFITRVIPSVAIAYKTPIWDLMLADTFQWWYYAKQDRGFYSNDGNLASKLIVINNLVYFDVTDTYSSVVLNPRGPSTTSNLNVNRTDANVLNAVPYIKYQINPTTAATIGGTYTNIWYRGGGGVNREEYKGFVTLGHTFSARFNALLGGEYLADRPEGQRSDNDQTAAFTSLFFTLDPKTRFDGTVGYRWIRFTEGPDHNSPIYNVGLAYQFVEKGQVQLRASQLFSTSPTQGIVKNTAQQLTASYGESFSINGGIYHTRDFYFEIGQTNDAVGGTVGLIYTPTSRLAYRISGRYEKDNFLPQHQKRDVYGGSAGIDYKLTAKATLSITDDYNKSTGQIETDNFTDNIVGLQLRIEF